jgi:iron(III) transport system substrate-binding protein
VNCDHPQWGDKSQKLLKSNLRMMKRSVKKPIMPTRKEEKMRSIIKWIPALTLGIILVYGLHPVQAQQIENSLVVNSSMGKLATNAALDAFKAYVGKRFGIDIDVGAVHGGGQMIYSKVIEWAGNPQADIMWGSDAWMFEELGKKGLMSEIELDKEAWESVPASYGEPKPLVLKDPNKYWIGTSFVPWAVSYNPKLLEKLGVPPIKSWDDLINPKLKGQVVSCTPDRSSSNHASVEAQLQRLGWEKGWDFLERMAANVHIFVARSSDVASTVARGEAAVGFGTTGFGAFDLRKKGFDIKLAVVPYSYITPEPIGIIKNAKNPKAAKIFVDFLLSAEGQQALAETGCFPIIKTYRVAGPKGSLLELGADLYGLRSFYDEPLYNVTDVLLSKDRYQEVNKKFKEDILDVHKNLIEKYYP